MKVKETIKILLLILLEVLRYLIEKFLQKEKRVLHHSLSLSPNVS